MNKKNNRQTEQTERKRRIRSAAYRWAVERLGEVLEQAEQIKSKRLWQLEHWQQFEAIEDVRRRLWGREVADSVQEFKPMAGVTPVLLTRSNI